MITTETNELCATYGVMGGYMQPQGHVQVFNNLRLFGFNPQEALDAPRICLEADSSETDKGLGSDTPIHTGKTIISIEEGIPEDVYEGLRKLGHNIRVVKGNHRSLFGRGQVIKADWTSNGLVYSGGSDLRGDGAALPFY